LKINILHDSGKNNAKLLSKKKFFKYIPRFSVQQNFYYLYPAVYALKAKNNFERQKKHNFSQKRLKKKHNVLYYRV